MKSSSSFRRGVLFATALTFAFIFNKGQAEEFVFNGAAEHQNDNVGYYYAITGGLFPTGTSPNGDNASGGTFRRIYDDPAWGGSVDTWLKDDWFPENAGLALTLYQGGVNIYDNNGIDNGSYGDFYDATAQGVNSADAPGLYRAYSMSNNYDHVYATYFKLEAETTFDTIVGFFDANAGLDPFSEFLQYNMNIWSSTVVGADLLPTNTGSFIGDVFSTHTSGGTITVTDSNVDRVYGANDGSVTDDIFRVEFKLDAPITLAAGEYFFSHDAAIVPEPSSYVLLSGMFSIALISYVVSQRRQRRAA